MLTVVVVVAMAAGVGLTVFAGDALGWWQSPGWLGAVGTGLLLVVGGAGGVGGALQAPGLFRRGLMPTPRTPWRVEIDRRARVLQIAVGAQQASVPLGVVRRARFFVDDDFDGLRGIEDALELTLDDARVVRIPACADGFIGVLGAFEAELERVLVV